MRSVKPRLVRWIGWLLLTILFGITCLALANWQLERRNQAVDEIQRIYANYDSQPISISETRYLTAIEILEFEWKPVSLEGYYLPDQNRLVRNRPLAGQPGFIQLVPFRTSDGDIYLIERGWIAADSNLEPSTFILPSSETKKLTGRIRISESSPNRKSPAGQVTSINLKDLAQSGLALTEKRFYLRLITESPPESIYPIALSKPSLDEGNHLSYAVQWVLFAILAIFAFVWAVRQDQRLFSNTPKMISSRRRSRKKVNDEIYEDQIIDKL